MEDANADFNILGRGLTLRSSSLCGSWSRRNYEDVPSLSLRTPPTGFIWRILGNRLLPAGAVLVPSPPCGHALGHTTCWGPPTVTWPCDLLWHIGWQLCDASQGLGKTGSSLFVPLLLCHHHELVPGWACGVSEVELHLLPPHQGSS